MDAAAPPPAMGLATTEAGSSGVATARRSRRRRSNFSGEGSLPEEQATAGDGRTAFPEPRGSDDGVPPALQSPCVVDWSDRVGREEESLRLAVIITAIGAAAVVPMGDVANLLAAKSDLVAESLVLRRSGLVEFLVFMADEESAINLAKSNDSPADNGSIRLHCRRWTHFALSVRGCAAQAG